MTTAPLWKINNGRTDLVFEYLAQATGTPDHGEILRAYAYYGDVSAMKYLLANGTTFGRRLQGATIEDGRARAFFAPVGKAQHCTQMKIKQKS
jgi:hypothetical protein